MSNDDIYPPEFSHPRETFDDDPKREQNRLFVRRMLIFIAILVTFALLGGIGAGVWAIRDSQVKRGKTVDNTAVAADQAREGTELIRGCVTPGMKCYDDAAERQAALLAKLINNNQAAAAAAASCASKLDLSASESDFERYKAVLACEIRVLSRDRQ